MNIERSLLQSWIHIPISVNKHSFENCIHHVFNFILVFLKLKDRERHTFKIICMKTTKTKDPCSNLKQLINKTLEVILALIKSKVGITLLSYFQHNSHYVKHRSSQRYLDRMMSWPTVGNETAPCE